MPNAKGLGYSQNRRVSGQRLCLLILQISISADRDVPAFSKAGTFFLLRYLKTAEKYPLYSRRLFENVAHLFSDKRQKHVRVLFGDFNVHHKIPLDFFSGIAYTDSEETHVSVFRAEPLPVTGGGAAHFLYLRANRREPFFSNAITLKPNPVLTTLRTALSSTMRISSSVLMDPVHCNTTPPGVFAICFVAFRIAISAAFAMEGKFFALPPNLQEFCPL